MISATFVLRTTTSSQPKAVSRATVTSSARMATPPSATLKQEFAFASRTWKVDSVESEYYITNFVIKIIHTIFFVLKLIRKYLKYVVYFSYVCVILLCTYVRQKIITFNHFKM